MKKVILPLFAILACTSCTKTAREIPQIDPNKAYTIKYNTSDQIAKTRVSNDTLRLDLYQNINFLLDPNEYANTWALHLVQDFSKSYLRDLHYDAIAIVPGQYAHDWVPINLNDAAEGQKTITNVIFEGKKYVQISLKRTFEFYSVLGSNQTATEQQNVLLQTSTDSVTYKAFYSYNNVYSLSSDSTFKIVYVKQ
jgi:hypothetical protein